MTVGRALKGVLDVISWTWQSVKDGLKKKDRK